MRGGKPDDTAAISSPRGYLSSVIRGSNHAGPEIQDRLRSKDATPSSSGQIVQNTQDGTQGAQGADGSEERSTRPVPFEPGKTMRDKKRSSMWPRTFHLSAGSKSLSSHSMVSSHGIRKSRSGRRDLAVFEEKIKTARDLGVLNAEYQKGTDLSGQGTGMSRAAEGNHRNPKAQAVASIGGELLVAECAPEAPGGDKAILRSRKVEEVLERLPQAASDKTHTGTINDAPLQPQIKFQPQPSKARRDENPTGFGALGHLPDAEDPESQDDFVYDTYLRTKQPMVGSQPGCPMDIDQLEGIADGKVGILVIAEQDEAVWEAYAEEEESDKDWNSEEEDENGIFPTPSERLGKNKLMGHGSGGFLWKRLSRRRG